MHLYVPICPVHSFFCTRYAVYNTSSCISLIRINECIYKMLYDDNERSKGIFIYLKLNDIL